MEEEVSQLGLWVLPRSSTSLKPPDRSRPGRNPVTVVRKESPGVIQAMYDKTGQSVLTD